MTIIHASTQRGAKTQASKLLGKCGWVFCAPDRRWYHSRVHTLSCKTATVETRPRSNGGWVAIIEVHES